MQNSRFVVYRSRPQWACGMKVFKRATEFKGLLRSFPAFWFAADRSLRDRAQRSLLLQVCSRLYELEKTSYHWFGSQTQLLIGPWLGGVDTWGQLIRRKKCQWLGASGFITGSLLEQWCLGFEVSLNIHSLETESTYVCEASHKHSSQTWNTMFVWCSTSAWIAFSTLRALYNSCYPDSSSTQPQITHFIELDVKKYDKSNVFKILWYCSFVNFHKWP